jgi:hypothetical protein
MKLRELVLAAAIIFLVLAIFPATKVFASSYDRTWYIYSTSDTQQQPFANILVKYSLPDNARGPVNVNVSLTYTNDAEAHLDWITVYDIAVHLRNTPKGTDVAVSATDSSQTKLTPGSQYSNQFSIRAQPGQYLVILTWKVVDSGGSAYGYSITGNEVTFDIGDASDSSSIPKVTVQSQPVLIITFEPAGTVTGSVSVDGKSLPMTNGTVKIDLTPGQHTVGVPSQIDLGQGQRAVFQDWSDGDTSNPKQVSSDTDLALVAHYKTQYLLTVTSDLGNPQGSGWYDAGAHANFSVTQPNGFLVTEVFDHWEGDFSGTSPSASVDMNAPKTVTAVWRTDYTQLLILIAVAGILGVLVVALLMKRRAGPKMKATPKVESAPAPLPKTETQEVRAPPATVQGATKRCIHCGATIPAIVLFCTKCGKKQE